MSDNVEPQELSRVEFVRRELIAGWQMHSRKAALYIQIDKPSEAEKVALVGSLMAATYAYTLSGVLSLIRDQCSVEAAEHIAELAMRVLDDGDELDLNADLIAQHRGRRDRAADHVRQPVPGLCAVRAPGSGRHRAAQPSVRSPFRLPEPMHVLGAGGRVHLHRGVRVGGAHLMATCPECGTSSRAEPGSLWIEEVITVTELGSLLSGSQLKTSARRNLMLRCRCGWSIAGWIEGDHFVARKEDL